MLAYAAQGLASEPGGPAGSEVREHVQRCHDALEGLGDVLRSAIDEAALGPAAPYRAFLAVLDRDAGDARATVDLVLAQPSISSQLIDNLNASVHLRSLLTDLFLIDEILKGRLSAGEPRAVEP